MCKTTSASPWDVSVGLGRGGALLWIWCQRTDLPAAISAILGWESPRSLRGWGRIGSHCMMGRVHPALSLSQSVIQIQQLGERRACVWRCAVLNPKMGWTQTCDIKCALQICIVCVQVKTNIRTNTFKGEKKTILWICIRPTEVSTCSLESTSLGSFLNLNLH